MCLCQSVYLSNCPRPHLVGIDQRDHCVGIDTLAVNSPLLSLYSTIIYHTLLSKCINICFQEYLPSIMTFLTGKLIFKKKSKTGFQNRKPDFRLTSLVDMKDCAIQQQFNLTLNVKLFYKSLVADCVLIRDVNRKPENRISILETKFGFAYSVNEIQIYLLKSFCLSKIV